MLRVSTKIDGTLSTTSITATLALTISGAARERRVFVISPTISLMIAAKKQNVELGLSRVGDNSPPWYSIGNKAIEGQLRRYCQPLQPIKGEEYYRVNNSTANIG